MQHILPSLFLLSLFTSDYTASKPFKCNFYTLSDKKLNIRCPKLKMSDFQERPWKLPLYLILLNKVKYMAWVVSAGRVTGLSCHWLKQLWSPPLHPIQKGTYSQGKYMCLTGPVKNQETSLFYFAVVDIYGNCYHSE